jgi:hypothetical protein
MTREEPTEISVREIEQALQQGIAGADPDRAEGLAELTRLGEAREAGLRREYQRLARVLPRDDPRLEGLILRLEASRALRQEAGFEIERSKTGVPAPDKEVWILYGFVRGADPGSLEDKNMALFDLRGTRVQGSEAALEKDGRFLLRFKAPTGPERERAPAGEVFVTLVDARGHVVYRDPRGLRPENGRIAYVEIDLPAEKEPPPRPSRPREPGEAPTPAPEERPRRGRQPSASSDEPDTGGGRRGRSRRTGPAEGGSPGPEAPR